MAVAADILSALVDRLTIGNVLLAILFLFLLNMLWELYEFRGMPPGPRFSNLPIIGNLLSFDLNGEDLQSMTSGVRKKYGRVFTLKAGSFKFVVACSPESIKEVLVKRSADYAGRPPFYSFLVISLGGKDIAFGDYGPAWKFHRKLFTTSLRQYLSNIPLLESRVGEQANKLLQYFEDQKGMPFNPSDVLMRSVADVICGITFGDHFNSSHTEFTRFLAVTNKALSDVDRNGQVFVLDLLPFTKYLPLKAYKQTQEIADYLFKVTRDILVNRQQGFDESDPVDDLMTALLKARAEAEFENEGEKQVLLSDDYLINTMFDMFSAGYETTSTTLKWVIIFLVNNPQYQQEIQEKLDEVVGSDRMPSLEDRSKLPIIQATIMETLRLANVVDVAIPHYTLKDTSLCGYRVPKDTVVIVDLESLHLDPKCWENPTEFNPHRHLDTEGQLITNQGNFLPFSAGRRVCAGESLAKVELFLFLSWMLHKFTFAPEEGQPPPVIQRMKGFTQYPKAYQICSVKRQK